MAYPFCGDCPDREACSTGYTCELVKKINLPKEGLMSKRYTAVVKIVEVTESTTTREYGKDIVTPGKDTELANLVVRAKSLNVLKTKLKAHIDLTEEL